MSRIARRLTGFSDKEMFEYNSPTDYSSVEEHRPINNVRINAGEYILNMKELNLGKEQLLKNIPDTLKLRC